MITSVQVLVLNRQGYLCPGQSFLLPGVCRTRVFLPGIAFSELPNPFSSLNSGIFSPSNRTRIEGGSNQHRTRPPVRRLLERSLRPGMCMRGSFASSAGKASQCALAYSSQLSIRRKGVAWNGNRMVFNSAIARQKFSHREIHHPSQCKDVLSQVHTMNYDHLVPQDS